MAASSEPVQKAQELIESNDKDTLPTDLKWIIKPETSKSDNREYAIFALPNGLECIVVSDPDTEKGACCMDVGVGHFCDPSGIEGLAHFLEHMLFLGTKKYPNEAEYDQFIKDYGGSNNASTHSHHTNYSFDIDSHHLSAAIDRFAQFFIGPLFTESATKRELNAVHSEHCNNLQDDYCRLFQFDKLQSLKQHPWHKFDTGNLDTLKEDDSDQSNDMHLRTELLKFHRTYYNPSIMKLAVYAKEDINTVVNLCYNTFKAIEDDKNDFVAPSFSLNVFDKSAFPKLYKILPIEDKRDLVISWMLDPIYAHYKSRPTSLLSYCIGHESKGSILSYLKDVKGFATGLCAGISYNKPEFAIFECSVTLTIEGLQHWQEVVHIIYEYIAKLKLLSDEQWKMYFNERQKVDTMRFHFKGKEHPYDYVESLSRALQKYNERETKQHLLQYSHHIAFEFKPDLIKRYLGMLTPANSYYYLIAKEYEEETVQEEKWYGTKYKEEKIEQSVLQKWSAVMNDEDEKHLYAPLENKYIASDFEIYPDDEEKEEEKEAEHAPKVIYASKQCKIWYKKDKVFKRPKLACSFRIYSPVLDKNVRSQNLSHLFISIFNDILAEQTYEFEEADLFYKCKYRAENCLYFEFVGFNEKLHLLMQTVMDKFASFRELCTPQKFEIHKEKLRQKIHSKLKDDPYKQCSELGGYLYVKKRKSVFQLMADINDEADEISYDGLLKHYEEVLTGKLFIECLIFGNYTKELVKQNLIPLVEMPLKNAKQYEPQELIKEKQDYLCMKFENNSNYILRFDSTNEEDSNSCIGIDYFCVPDSNKVDKIADIAKLKLLCWLMDAPFFDELRTKQQLGYIVWSFQQFNNGMYSLRCVIQSPSASPTELDLKIEAFLNEQFKTFLSEMEDEMFEVNKQSVINDLLEKPKTIKEQHMRYWTEIAIERVQFDRDRRMADAVGTLTKEQIVEFYDTYICRESTQRMKVSQQCFVVEAKGDKDEKTEAKPTKDQNNQGAVVWTVEDVDKVKMTASYHTFPYQ